MDSHDFSSIAPAVWNSIPLTVDPLKPLAH